MSLIEKLRARHFAKTISCLEESEDGRTDWWVDHEICNQDGQAWPCFTEETMREHEASKRRCVCGHRETEHVDGICGAPGDYIGRWADKCIKFRPQS